MWNRKRWSEAVYVIMSEGMQCFAQTGSLAVSDRRIVRGRAKSPHFLHGSLEIL